MPEMSTISHQFHYKSLQYHCRSFAQQTPLPFMTSPPRDSSMMNGKIGRGYKQQLAGENTARQIYIRLLKKRWLVH